MKPYHAPKSPLLTAPPVGLKSPQLRARRRHSNAPRPCRPPFTLLRQHAAVLLLPLMVCRSWFAKYTHTSAMYQTIFLLDCFINEVMEQVYTRCAPNASLTSDETAPGKRFGSTLGEVDQPIVASASFGSGMPVMVATSLVVRASTTETILPMVSATIT